MGWAPSYQSEGHAYATYILREKPDGKIAVLYQNDDFGKDYLKGVKDGLGDKAGMVVLAAAYETNDPTIDAQIIAMKAAGADVFVNTAIAKFAPQAIRKAAEIQWQPLHILATVAASVAATLRPAGLENAKGIVSDFYMKDPTDPQWKDDPRSQRLWSRACADASPGIQAVRRRSEPREHYEGGGQSSPFPRADAATRIEINTSPTDFAPIKQIQMARFDGQHWQSFGPLIGDQAPA
jgi:branched-chain amino acid transport system substrate-binding protein